MNKLTTNIQAATRGQWIRFGVVTLLYLAFLLWVKSWLGLVILPFIFDVYISKIIPWSWWKQAKSLFRWKSIIPAILSPPIRM